MYDVIIIGAGAAGMMAAGTAAQNGKKVLVIEKMEKAGRKIRITGKGRCNLTNARPPEEFAEQVRTNADFFATAFAEFNNRATIRFFERRGLKLDFERGDRVFPRSGKAWDVANTLEEFVMSAEYIMAEGNENVILCERGIRTFETSMRNTLDLAGVVMLHKMTHLPVIVDPSHACGHAWMVPDLAKAAVAAGADGLMIEVHNNPAKAKCDGAQSLTPDQFDELMQFIGKEVEFFGKKLN